MIRRAFMGFLVAGAFGFLAPTTSALAQQTIVDGYVVNLGITPAAAALRADGHRDAHPTHPPAGSEHLLITLDDEKTKSRVGDAEVVIEVVDPHKHVERKPLLHTQSGGLPDYSELFVFAWSGDYTIRVLVTPRSGKPFQAQFKISHEV